MKIEHFTLSNEKIMKIFKAVFNSTCLPSGSLVDGLPLDLHRRLIAIRARAFKFFFLPCDPVGKINSLYNKEVYRSRYSLFV